MEVRSYRIRLQPNLERTLGEPGTIETTLDLTLDQYNGIRAMGFVLLGGEANHHFEITDSYGVFIQPMMPSSVTVSTARSEADYFTIIDLLNQGNSWSDVIMQTVAEVALIPDNLTGVFWDILTREFWVIQFETPQFLQGAISLCQWFGLNWHDHITDLHNGNTAVKISNM